MERLTTRTSIMGRKHDIAYGCASIWKKKLKNDKYELIENAVDKLGQLEDIEEELGIDLGTLLKALKNGIYVYSKLDECICHVHVRLNFNGTQWLLISDDFAIFPKKLTNYRKTWALTKEELEK